MTAVDEWPALVPWLHCPADLAAEARESERRDRLMYELGRADGWRESETSIAAHWAKLARSVRATAERLRGPVPEPIVRSKGDGDDSIWFTPGEWASRVGNR